MHEMSAACKKIRPTLAWKHRQCTISATAAGMRLKGAMGDMELAGDEQVLRFVEALDLTHTRLFRTSAEIDRKQLFFCYNTAAQAIDVSSEAGHAFSIPGATCHDITRWAELAYGVSFDADSADDWAAVGIAPDAAGVRITVDGLPCPLDSEAARTLQELLLHGANPPDEQPRLLELNGASFLLDSDGSDNSTCLTLLSAAQEARRVHLGRSSLAGIALRIEELLD